VHFDTRVKERFLLIMCSLAWLLSASTCSTDETRGRVETVYFIGLLTVNYTCVGSGAYLLKGLLATNRFVDIWVPSAIIEKKKKKKTTQ
jgi:hypothetical protein